MNKTIIVYFSHSGENYFSGSIKNIKTGNTKVLCEKLSKMIQADVFEIQPVQEYPNNYQACTTLAKQELKNQDRPAIQNTIPCMEEVQTIFLAYPNWWGTYPRIVSTFLESYDLAGKDIYPICTHEGSGMGRSVEELKRACPKSIIHSGLAVQGSFVQDCEKELRKYVGGN